MDGFSTALSHGQPRQIGSSTIQSPATAGVAGRDVHLCCRLAGPAATRDEILVTNSITASPCILSSDAALDENMRRAKAKRD